MTNEISDPEGYSLAGQMAAMRGGSVKESQQDEENDEESSTDDDDDQESEDDSGSDDDWCFIFCMIRQPTIGIFMHQGAQEARETATLDYSESTTLAPLIHRS
ncbi:hypothetical protein PQX77_021501 [Marasmius sp. AFHP31]|nr:hypothetical protein PQX77_021501 [Marasmius sp. AFHP31]